MTLTGCYITTILSKKPLQPLPYNVESVTFQLQHQTITQHNSISIHPSQSGKCLYACSGIKNLLRDVLILTVVMSMFATAASMPVPSETTITRLSVVPIKKGKRPNQQDDSLAFWDKQNYLQPRT